MSILKYFAQIHDYMVNLPIAEMDTHRSRNRFSVYIVYYYNHQKNDDALKNNMF